MRLYASLFITLLLAMLTAYAVDPTPVAGTSVFGDVTLPNFSTGGAGAAANAVFTIVPVTGQTFKQAIQVKVATKTANPWDVQIGSPSSIIPLKKGDYLLATFSVRCTDSVSGTGSMSAYIQSQGPPWVGIATKDVVAGKDWQQIFIHVQADRDFPAGKYDLSFHLGTQAQTLEIGGISLLNLGTNVDVPKLPTTPLSYVGMEPNAPWRKAAAARIEQIRKGDLAIHFTDPAGKPLLGAQVHIQMLRQAYGFGTFLEYQTLVRIGDDGDKLRANTLKMFNRCTTPIYWSDWGWGVPEVQSDYLLCAQWALDNKLTTRGHCIIYPGWDKMPRRIKLLTNDPPALQKALLEHIIDVTEHTKKYNFAEYDVTNELRDLTEVTNILGKSAVVEWFKTARQHAQPTTKMAINENTILTKGGDTQAQQDNYAGWIQYLIDQGQAPDVIGMQGHFNSTVTPPDTVLRILDRFAKFGKPLQITEFDLPIDDEQGQAQYLHDFLTAVYSHPATDAFTMWGFWEGRMWNPQAALMRKDWTLKPNGKVWMELVRKEWWTDETIITDAKGAINTRAFLGDYNITVTVNGKEHSSLLSLKQTGVNIAIAVD